MVCSCCLLFRYLGEVMLDAGYHGSPLPGKEKSRVRVGSVKTIEKGPKPNGGKDPSWLVEEEASFELDRLRTSALHVLGQLFHFATFPGRLGHFVSVRVWYVLCVLAIVTAFLAERPVGELPWSSRPSVFACAC